MTTIRPVVAVLLLLCQAAGSFAKQSIANSTGVVARNVDLVFGRDANLFEQTFVLPLKGPGGEDTKRVLYSYRAADSFHAIIVDSSGDVPATVGDRVCFGEGQQSSCHLVNYKYAICCSLHKGLIRCSALELSADGLERVGDSDIFHNSTAYPTYQYRMPTATLSAKHDMSVMCVDAIGQRQFRCFSLQVTPNGVKGTEMLLGSVVKDAFDRLLVELDDGRVMLLWNEQRMNKMGAMVLFYDETSNKMVADFDSVVQVTGVRTKWDVDLISLEQFTTLVCYDHNDREANCQIIRVDTTRSSKTNTKLLVSPPVTFVAGNTNERSLKRLSAYTAVYCMRMSKNKDMLCRLISTNDDGSSIVPPSPSLSNVTVEERYLQFERNEWDAGGDNVNTLGRTVTALDSTTALFCMDFNGAPAEPSGRADDGGDTGGSGGGGGGSGGGLTAGQTIGIVFGALAGIAALGGAGGALYKFYLSSPRPSQDRAQGGEVLLPGDEDGAANQQGTELQEAPEV
eukprot:jgi/Bigna1/79557/fgenesh1_pg.63_\